jgi:hypothetical protein
MKTLLAVLNLFNSSEEELRQAFDFVERPGFFDKGPFGINSESRHSIKGIRANRARISKDYENGPFTCEEIRELCDMNVGTIYGSNSYNRYFVYFDGRIVFSEYHKFTEEAICRAFLAGFEVRVEGQRSNNFERATGTITHRNGDMDKILGINDDRLICKVTYIGRHGKTKSYLKLVECDSIADFHID